MVFHIHYRSSSAISIRSCTSSFLYKAKLVFAHEVSSAILRIKTQRVPFRVGYHTMSSFDAVTVMVRRSSQKAFEEDRQSASTFIKSTALRTDMLMPQAHATKLTKSYFVSTSPTSSDSFCFSIISILTSRRPVRRTWDSANPSADFSHMCAQ